MSTPFEPALDEGPSPEADAFDVHVTLTMVLLVVIAGCLLSLGLFLVAGGVLMAFIALSGAVPPSPDQPPAPVVTVLAFLEAGFFLVPGALYGATARGLYLRTKWGWLGALVGLALLMGGCCMPFSLYGYFALLREPQRKMFGF